MPLDPSLPKERLLQLLRGSGAEVLLTRAGVSEVPGEFAGRVVLLEEAGIALQSGEDLAEVEGCLAYLMYTSGSMGAPKGVAVEHAQVLGYVQAILQRLGDVTGTHWATVSTFAADLGNTSIFASLCGGGCLHVIPQECVADPALLREYLASNPIDGLKIVPGHLSALLGSSEPRELLPRRWLVLGGEACGWELVERVQRAAPECRVLNHYGPTETTVGALTWEVRPAGGPAATVPLGFPLANSRVYVLDAGLQGVPAWVAGELYIGRGRCGAGLPEPSGADGGAVRARPVRLRVAGPAVPHRGPGALAAGRRAGVPGAGGPPGEDPRLPGRAGGDRDGVGEAPGVEEAAVMVREDACGERRWWLTWCRRGAAGPRGAAAAGWPRGCPSYMVPSALVMLAALPLTANGKLDRARSAGAARRGGRRDFVAPRTPVEEIVAGPVERLLGRGSVGREDDFFALGGHSLLATQLLARLCETFGVEMPLRTLFDEPTVAGLARERRGGDAAGAVLSTPPLEPASRDGRSCRSPSPSSGSGSSTS